MRNRNGLFILIVGLAFISAFLAYEPRRLTPVREHLLRAVAEVAPAAMSSLAPMIEKIAPLAPVPMPSVAAPGTPARIVRIPAIRESQNYGWIQLPRGTRVDLVEEQRDGFLVRYDESFVVIPRAAVQDGSVVLRNKRTVSAS